MCLQTFTFLKPVFHLSNFSLEANFSLRIRCCLQKSCKQMVMKTKECSFMWLASKNNSFLSRVFLWTWLTSENNPIFSTCLSFNMIGLRKNSLRKSRIGFYFFAAKNSLQRNHDYAIQNVKTMDLQQKFDKWKTGFIERNWIERKNCSINFYCFSFVSRYCLWNMMFHVSTAKCSIWRICGFFIF